MKQKGHSKLLTDLELELMNLVWRRGEASAADVLESLPKSRELAITTISTVLRILEQKKVLKVRKEGRGHIYVPILTKEQHEAASLQHLVKNVFDGTPSSLVRRLLDSEQLSAEELGSIQKLFNERLGK